MAKCPCGNGLVDSTKWGEICRICEHRLENQEWDEHVLEIVKRNGKKVFRFKFTDDSEEFGIGRTVDEAFKSIGLGSGAISALDYYEIFTKDHLKAPAFWQEKIINANDDEDGL